MPDSWEEQAKQFKPQPGILPSAPGGNFSAPNDDWKVWQQTGGSSAEKPGFLSSFVEGIKTGNPIYNPGAGEAMLHPQNAAKSYSADNNRLFNEAGQRFSHGDIIGGIREGANYLLNGIPGLGSSSEDASQEFDKGNYRAGFGKTAALGVDTAAGLAIPHVLGPVTRGVRGLVRADPNVAVTRALRPTPSQPGFTERIPSTVAAVKDANPGFKPAVTGGQFNLPEAVGKAIGAHQEALSPWLQRAQGTTISGAPIVEATRQATGEMLPSEGGAGQRLISQAEQDYGTFTPEALRDRLALLNQRLRGFYNKAPGAQSAALADIPESVLVAQRDAAAKALYQHLDPEGEGAGPRLIQSRTGDLIDLRDAALRRNNAIVAEQPLTPIGRITDPIKGAVRSFLPGRGSAGLAYAEGSEGRSLPLLKRGFSAVKQEPNVLPRPAGPYPTIGPDRQLGPSPLVTPPPADTSSVNVRTGPPLVNPRQLGPAPSVTPPPADTSGVRVTTGPVASPPSRQIGPPTQVQQGGFGVQDMVPVKDPVSGKWVYTPKSLIKPPK
jgi:hypothetical protein